MSWLLIVYIVGFIYLGLEFALDFPTEYLSWGRKQIIKLGALFIRFIWPLIIASLIVEWIITNVVKVIRLWNTDA